MHSSPVSTVSSRRFAPFFPALALTLLALLLAAPATAVETMGAKRWGKLFVETTPADASVRFLRIKYRYKPGIILEEGTYILEVSKPGYEPVLKEVEIRAGKDNVVQVNLDAPAADVAEPARKQDVQPERDLRIPLSQTLERTGEPAQQPATGQGLTSYSGQLPPAAETQQPAEAPAQEEDSLQALPAEDPEADAAEGPAIDEENPPSPEELMQVSNHLTQAGDLANAIQGFTLVIEQQPKNVNAYVGRGFAYYKLGNHEAAIEDFTKALELDNIHLSAWFHRGNAYLMAGDFEKAVADYEQALGISSTVPDIFNARGTALYNLGDYQAAIMDFDQAIILDPDYADAYFNRGSSYMKLNKPQLALDDFNMVLEITPQDDLAREKKKQSEKMLRP